MNPLALKMSVKCSANRNLPTITLYYAQVFRKRRQFLIKSKALLDENSILFIGHIVLVLKYSFDK